MCHVHNGRGARRVGLIEVMASKNLYLAFKNTDFAVYTLAKAFSGECSYFSQKLKLQYKSYSGCGLDNNWNKKVIHHTLFMRSKSIVWAMLNPIRTWGVAATADQRCFFQNGFVRFGISHLNVSNSVGEVKRSISHGKTTRNCFF